MGIGQMRNIDFHVMVNMYDLHKQSVMWNLVDRNHMCAIL